MTFSTLSLSFSLSLSRENGVIFDDNELTSLLRRVVSRGRKGGCFCFALLGFSGVVFLMLSVCVCVCVLNYAYQETI